MTRRACLIVQGSVVDDPRVSKQCRVLGETGRYDVHAIGVRWPGRPCREAAWRNVTIEHVDASTTPSYLARRSDTVRRLLTNVIPSTSFATRTFFRFPRHNAELLARALAAAADVYHANDWDTLPIAVAAAAQRRARVIYETHELAVAEDAGLRFRILRGALRARIERGHLARAQHVITISNGLADHLARRYGLDRRKLTVIRNVADLSEPVRAKFDPSRIRVLYHGVVRPGRGIDVLIASVARWPAPFSLAVRGVWTREYREHLEGLTRVHGVTTRVSFLEPVPTDELVRTAAEFDIGIIPASDRVPNNIVGLPNKLFEYAMAGLAVFSTDLPDIQAVIVANDLGRTFASDDPEAIARALRDSAPGDVARWQENARRFSRSVHTGTEFAKLVAIYDGLLEEQMDEPGHGLRAL